MALIRHFHRIAFVILSLAVLCLLAMILNVFKKFDRTKANTFLKLYGDLVMKAFQIYTELQYQQPISLSEKTPYIIMSNHNSLLDIPVILSTLLGPLGAVRFLAKKELFRIPLFGNAIHQAQMISIDRHSMEQAKKDLAVAKQALEDGLTLIVFPEGTRSDDENLLPFKKGAFFIAIEMGATIIPVRLKGVSKILPARSLEIHPKGNVQICIGTPICCQNYTIENREDLVQKVRSEILAL